MSMFDKIRLIFTWLPEVMKAIAVVELAASPGTPGAEKKAAVLGYLATVSVKLKLPWGDEAIATLSSTIDTVVAIMNLVGRFRHRADTPAPELAAETAAAPAPAVLRANLETVAADDEAFERFLHATER